MRKLIVWILSVCLLLTFSFEKTNRTLAEEDPYMIEYAMLVDPTGEELIEEEVYDQISSTLKGNYKIDVQAFYESKEAIEEGLYNSKETEYFGFLVSEVDAQFEGTPYVFCVDETGKTVVKEFVPYDDVWGKVLKNVAIGGGVIFVCVTLTYLTAGGAAPALHMIFTAATKDAVKYGFRSALAMGIRGIIAKYAETGNIEEALTSGAMEASEGFKWGVIGGAIKGTAAESIKLYKLHRTTKLPLNTIADILENTNFSDNTLKNIHSTEEYKIYQGAKLVEYESNGRKFLIPEDMDWDFVDPATKLTNRQLIEKGLNPVDKQGIKYQWHHVGQKKNSTLALLTQQQHRDNYSVLHPITVSEVRPNGDNSFWIEDKANALQALAQLLNTIL